MQPTVSVIMPVYNAEPYVAEAIDSVLAQTFRGFELIIVDDGSTDESRRICQGYTDGRIQFVPQKNKGIAGALNTGIQHARGQFIAFLGAKDRWLPEKLELHVVHLSANPHVGVTYAGSRFIDGEGKSLRIVQQPKLRDVSAVDVFCRNPVGNRSSAIIRRDELDRVAAPHPVDCTRMCFFDESLKQSEDIEMWLRLALVGEAKFEGIPGILTEYRMVNGGLSARVLRQYQSWEAVVERLRDLFPEFVKRHEGRAKAYQLRYLARRMIQLGDPGMAIAFLKESMKASKRPFIEEPTKSAVTYIAAFLGTKVSPETFSRLMRLTAGGRLVT